MGNHFILTSQYVPAYRDSLRCSCETFEICIDFCFVSQGDTSGDYKKLLLKLCGGSD